VRVTDGADFGLVAKALKMEEDSFLRGGGLLVVVGFLAVVESDFVLEVPARGGLVVVVVGSGVGALAGAGLGAVALDAAAGAGFASAGGGGGRAPVRRCVVVRMIGAEASSGLRRTFARGLYIVPYVFHVCSRSSLAYSVVILRLQSDRIWMF